MKTKIIEASNGVNWGKMLIGRFDAEWDRAVKADPEVFGSLLDACGWTGLHIWVMDLQTGEGAIFCPGGDARADLVKHAIWVCPLFEPFLEWLYQQDLADLDALPDIVLMGHVPPQLRGYRRPGPDFSERRIRGAYPLIRRIAREEAERVLKERRKPTPDD